MCGRLIVPGHAPGLSEVQTQLEGRCVKSLVWPDWAPAAGSRSSQLRRPGHCVWLLRPEVIPYRLLLQPRAGLPELPAEPEPVLAPLLADPLAVDDAITALRPVR